MRLPFAIGTLTLALLGSSGMAAAAGPESGPRVLGPRGEVYQLRYGSLGELVSGIDSGEAGHSALALETLRNDEIVREIVPGTDDDAVESDAAMLYEPTTDTLYLAWGTRFNFLHSKITVLWYHDGVWSEPIELGGSAFAEKSAPRIAFTYETFRESAAGESPIERSRSIVHTLWTEVTGDGSRVVYAPVVFEDGVPTGEVAEFTLDPRHLVTDPEQGTLDRIPLAPTLSRGRGQTVLVTLGDSDLLSVLRIDPVPIALTRLGDGVRASIVPVGLTACQAPDGLARIASAARDAVWQGPAAGWFHDSVLQHVATAVVSRISSAGCGGGIDLLADSVYETVLESGSDALGSGTVRLGSGVRASIVPVGLRPMDGTGLDHRLRFDLASVHAAPASHEGRPLVRSSSDGARVIVAWETENGLAFSESGDASGWSDSNVLRLDQHLDLDAALGLLDRRLDSR